MVKGPLRVGSSVKVAYFIYVSNLARGFNVLFKMFGSYGSRARVGWCGLMELLWNGQSYVRLMSKSPLVKHS